MILLSDLFKAMKFKDPGEGTENVAHIFHQAKDWISNFNQKRSGRVGEKFNKEHCNLIDTRNQYLRFNVLF